MRELSEKEIGAITGGYSPGGPNRLSNWYQPWRPPNPLTVTFGTPVEPGPVLPCDTPSWLF